LKIPEEGWKDLSMDFMVGLPESEGYNAILVVVDRLTIIQHLVLCTDQVHSKKLGEMYIEEVFWLLCLLQSIESDRRSQIVSKFVIHVCERLGIESWWSTAVHL
jgi:hypothetical protein